MLSQYYKLLATLEFGITSETFVSCLSFIEHVYLRNVMAFNNGQGIARIRLGSLVGLSNCHLWLELWFLLILHNIFTIFC